MWLPDRRTLVAVLAAAALTGCGFAPVYGPQGKGQALLDRVSVTAPDSRAGFLVVRRIEERLGRAAPTAPLSLTVTPVTRTRGLGSTEDGRTTRFQVVGRAAFRLSDTATGAVIDEGETTNLTGYSATGSTVATLAAERDALERLMVILGDQIVDRLLLSAP